MACHADPPVGGHSCNGGMIPRFYRRVSVVGAGEKRWRHREAERLAVVRSMTRSNFVEARRMRVCYPSRPSARMVSCTFGLAPMRAMYALMFGHFARSILWILVQLSTVNR